MARGPLYPSPMTEPSPPPATETGADRVAGLRIETVGVPLPEPHRTASGVITESPLVLVEVRTGQGETGQGIVFTYTRAALKPVAQLLVNIEELVVGEVLEPRRIEAQLQGCFRLLGTQGLVGMALAGVDMALWDALTRSRGQSLVRYLNGQYRPIPAYCGIGYDGPDASARAAEHWVKRGFRGVKAKIGYPAVDEDLAVVRAIRSAVGPDVAVMVDYNQSLSVAEAVTRLRMLDDEGLAWVEEPTLANDFAGHAMIARAVRTPVQCGENWWGDRELRTAADAGASDYVMPDVMKVGGVTGWLRASKLAQTRGMRVSSHLWPELSAQLLSVTPTAHWLEYADWWNPVLAEPLDINDGYADIRHTVGTGVRFDPEAVKKYRI